MPIIKVVKEESYSDYLEKVFDCMEGLGVPDLVLCFNAEDVARSFQATILTNYALDISPRMCAIICWLQSWEQVKREVAKAVKN